MLRTTAYPVACYWMLVRVVGSCYIRLHTTANTDAATPLPTLLTQQCWKLLLRPFARSFTDHLRQNVPQRQGVYLDERFLLLFFCFPFVFVFIFYFIFGFCFFVFLLLLLFFSAFCCIVQILLLSFKTQWESQM